MKADCAYERRDLTCIVPSHIHLCLRGKSDEHRTIAYFVPGSSPVPDRCDRSRLCRSPVRAVFMDRYDRGPCNRDRGTFPDKDRRAGHLRHADDSVGDWRHVSPLEAD